MTTFRNYKRYRELKLRNAWMLAGIDKVILPFLQGVALAAVLLFAFAVVSKTVEAGQVSADNRVAAKVAKQDAYIKQLESLLAKCLSGGDNPITIGGELWLCGATSTGVRK